MMTCQIQVPISRSLSHSVYFASRSSPVTSLPLVLVRCQCGQTSPPSQRQVIGRRLCTRSVGKWAVLTSAVVCGCGAVVWSEVLPLPLWSTKVVDVLESKPHPYVYLHTKIRHWNEEKTGSSWKEHKVSWFPWLKAKSEDPWTLLRLAQSDSHTVRLIGVNALASMHDWHDHQYRQIAQACDSTTVVGLARLPDVDPRFFLPPPPLPPEESTTEDAFRKLLSCLPRSGVSQCLQYFTSNALHEGNVTEERGGLWCFGGTGLEFTKSLSPYPVEKVEIFCLEALAIHSTVTSHCPDIIKLGGLQLLQRLQLLRRKSYVVKRLVARIIGNLAIHPSLHADIIRAGWVSLLADWMNSPDLSLSFHSARALGNLDRDFGCKTYQYEDGVYLIHPKYRTSVPIYADVVFLHGLLGGPFKTWRQEDRARVEKECGRSASGDGHSEPYTFCWPKDWLAEDCPHLRVLSVEYDSNLTDWTAKCPWDSEKHSLAVRGVAMLDKLKQAGLGRRPIIWVGHSMGGLIIKTILEEAMNREETQDIGKNTRGIVFYSVPHRGSELANYSKQAAFLLNPSTEVQELSTDSLFLRSLHLKFLEFVQEHDIPCLSFGELEKTSLGLKLNVLIVPPESSDPGIGEYQPIEMNHLNVCKPSSKSSHLYQTTLAFVNRCVPHDLVENILKASLSEDQFTFELYSWH